MIDTSARASCACRSSLPCPRPTDGTHTASRPLGVEAHTPYTADEIDFLVGYVFPLDAWYIFPVSVVENRKSVCVRPGLKKSKYRQYEEAWALLRPADPEPKSETLASSAAGGT